MIYVNVVLTVTDAGDIDTVRELLAEQRRRSLLEPGCARFEVYHSQADRSVFLLMEHWDTQAHLDAHREADAFKTLYEPKVLPLVDRVPHPSDKVE